MPVQIAALLCVSPIGTSDLTKPHENAVDRLPVDGRSPLHSFRMGYDRALAAVLALCNIYILGRSVVIAADRY